MPRHGDRNPPDDNPPPFGEALPDLDNPPPWIDAAEDLEIDAPYPEGAALGDDDDDGDLDPANEPDPRRPMPKKDALRAARPLLQDQASGAWWIWTPAGYRRVKSDQSALIAHMGYYHPLLEVFVPGKKGLRPMTPGELWEKFGRTVERVIYDYCAGGSRFEADPEDRMRGTLYMQAGPVYGRRPEVRPVRHPKVERWLDLLGGEAAPRLLDWLATAHLLDRPTAALFVFGPPSAGKGLLAAGVAALFGGERVTLQGATSQFNASLLKSPVVHLDEGAAGGRTASARLRELIGESSHEIEEKHQPRATLHGCPRVLVTTNNPDALKIAEELTAEDEAAIGVRFLLIDVPRNPGDATRSAAGDHLEDLGGREVTADWIARDLGDGGKAPGKLCEHIRWLQVHRKVSPGPRFLVQGDADAWRRRAGERGGVATKILVVLAQLASGEKLDRPEEAAQRVVLYRGAGEAWVQATALQGRWGELTGDRSPPAVQTVAGHLRNLSLDNGPTQRRVNGERPRAYRIPASAVLEAAERHGIGDEERIRRWFGVLTATGRAEGER